MIKFFLLASVCLLCASFEDAEQRIYLENPSFEDIPKDATTPRGWDACGKYSTPDILPGYWGVDMKPADGKTFIGLIVREDNTWEYISQRLKQPLRRAGCYWFNISLARAAGYSGYSRPTKLRIWGGDNSCHKKELLAETKAIRHTTWKNYRFLFSPTVPKIKFLTIEAYYVGKKPYKGNLLLDNCSSLEVCIRAN